MNAIQRKLKNFVHTQYKRNNLKTTNLKITKLYVINNVHNYM